MAQEPLNQRDLARQARELFLQRVEAALDPLAAKVEAFLLDLLEQPATMAVAQDRRDASQLFRQQSVRWVEGARARLTRRMQHQQQTSSADEEDWSLLGEETVETQILAARAALMALDKGSDDFNELRLRLQHLEGGDGLDQNDTLLSINVTRAVVDAWLAVGLTREHWMMCHSALQQPLAQAIATGYKDANLFLLERGVLPEIDLRGLVRRAPEGALPPPLDTGDDGAGDGNRTGGAETEGAEAGPTAKDGLTPAGQAVPAQLLNFLSKQLPGVAEWFQKDGAAQGGQDAAAAVTRAQALVPANLPPIDWSSLAAGAAALRAQTRNIKEAASTEQEKAVIEVVGLIFDSILTEDRIPSSIRVWFARLQMPVLRHAIADPGFLSSDQHPARLLIDRMGSCVLGFDPSVSLEPLEQEIRRIVQVIEQYPDTGRRVYELMYKEFLDFLAKNLPQQESVSKVVDLAQQVEQRETLTVQYTIELRKLLGKAPVAEAVRSFLFQIWVDVMAQAAVKFGAQDERATRLRQAAADLLWASSAKASRQERAQVIARVPGLLTQLREGMGLLGMGQERQESEIKPISDTLADAFMSKTEPIDQHWLSDLTHSLEAVEDFLPDDDSSDLELTRDSLELITGEDASGIVVLPNTDKTPRPESLAQARALLPGAWFGLEHNGQEAAVQLAWQSTRKQLYLFVTPQKQSYLMQQGRVASYLQAGLLKPAESEALTTRATRSALEKLDANPERLLA